MEKKERVLVYCGTNNGEGFFRTIWSGNWDHIYGFEANPVLYQNIKEQLAGDPRVKMYNTILSDTHDEDQEFYILDANGKGKDYASSVVNVSEWLPDYKKISGNQIDLKGSIKLKTTNLNTFFKEEGITEIDFLLTDLEGSDFLVVNTIKDFLLEGRIKVMQCEVEPDHMPNKYKVLDNKLAQYKELVDEKYSLIYTDPYAEDHWFSVDHRWQLKDEYR